MNLQTWIIEPRDSLIVRDGKPFGVNITHATSLDFPFPSTTTGGVRTRIGLNQNGIFDYPKNRLDELKEIEVLGALLVELDDNGEIKEFYLPAPADAFLLQDEKQKEKKEAHIYRLLPLDIEKLSGDSSGNHLSNLPERSLFPVGLNFTDKKNKPCDDLKFWNWTELKRWLMGYERGSSKSLSNYGIKSLKKDSRVHVAINDKLASDDGNLFQTRGLEFNCNDEKLATAQKFALVVFVDKKYLSKLENKEKLAPLGGERRLVSWRKSEIDHQILNCPDDIKIQIIKDGYCRLMLLTPAYFNDGLPKSNAAYEIKAIACNRYQTVSGWDFAFTKAENGKTIYGQPKPTRRLVPTGSMLFVEIKTDVEQFLKSTWFNCIGDDPQAKKDGFGLCILGTWDGKPLTNWR